MGQTMSNDRDYIGILVLFFGMLLGTYLFHSLNQKSADSKIKEIENNCNLKLSDLQSQVNQAAENTRKIREEDKNEFQASQVTLNNRHNAKINVLEVELTSLAKECETLRIGRLAFQREIAESKLTIEILRGEINLNSVRYTATIDSLQQEVESLRKQLKDQKKKHDSAMESMQFAYDELNERLSQKSRGKMGLIAVRRSGEEDEEKMMMKHMIAEALIHEHRRETQEHSFVDDTKDKAAARSTED